MAKGSSGLDTIHYRQPTVSCVLPVYNGETYLHEAIRSVLSQTFTDFELLLIDDCSTDSSLEVLQKFINIDDRVRVIKNSQNLGLPDTLNVGLSAARGKYIARMDQDDLCHLTRFEKQVAFLEKNPGISILGTKWKYFPNNGIVPEVPLTHDKIKISTISFNPIGHPTVMFRRSMLSETGPYSRFYFPTEDYEMWCRSLDKVKAANLNEVLLDYRIHAEQTSAKRALRQRILSRRLQLRQINKFAHNPTLARRILNLKYGRTTKFKLGIITILRLIVCNWLFSFTSTLQLIKELQRLIKIQRQ